MTIGLAAKALTGKATHVATNLVQPSTEWFSSVSKRNSTRCQAAQSCSYSSSALGYKIAITQAL